MYEMFELLLELNGVTIYRVAKDTGISQATLLEWKGKKYTPKIDKLQKIADYFKVPVDFLQGKQPFEFWADIEKDRRKFLKACDINPDVLHLVWGINPSAPYDKTLEDFATFVNMALVSATVNEDGDWDVVVDPSYKKKPATFSGDGLSERERDLVMLMRQKTPEQLEVLYELLGGSK